MQTLIVKNITYCLVKICMKKEKNELKIEDSYDYLTHSASTTDCTGLMPTPASTEAEREAYQAIYHFMPKELNDDAENE